MQLIGFIHGIGNFHPGDKDKILTLELLQAEADKVYGPDGSRVVYLQYEDLLDSYVASKSLKLVAGTLGVLLSGVPFIFSLPADYFTDILQYYVSYRIRAAVSNHILMQLVVHLDGYGSKVDGITLVGHSLGSLVLLRILALLTKPSTKMSQDIARLPGLASNLAKISKFPIQAVLLGSPAFSRVKTIGTATRKLPLADSPLPDTLKAAFETYGHKVVNIWSEKDPVSGEGTNEYCHNINSKVGHSIIESPFENLMAYIQTLRNKATQLPPEERKA